MVDKIGISMSIMSSVLPNDWGVVAIYAWYNRKNLGTPGLGQESMNYVAVERAAEHLQGCNGSWKLEINPSSNRWSLLYIEMRFDATYELTRSTTYVRSRLQRVGRYIVTSNIITFERVWRNDTLVVVVIKHLYRSATTLTTDIYFRRRCKGLSHM